MEQTVYICNVCNQEFLTRGEAVIHYYDTHKKVKLR